MGEEEACHTALEGKRASRKYGKRGDGDEECLEEVTDEKLEALKKLDLNARYAALGQLSAGMARNINNTLAVIQGFSDLLLGGRTTCGGNSASTFTISTTGWRNRPD